MTRAGSSPLTRGKLVVGLCDLYRIGLIPAHAGKTRLSACQPNKVWAHPRSRGENRLGAHHRGVALGSSPLTRGKLTSLDSRQRAVGLIPAHAGKTPRTARKPSKKWAHPRSRGENFTQGIEAPLDLGSSPLTRGKRVPRAPRDDRNGLIPAHAGKTTPARPSPSASWAHPRSRGENLGPARGWRDRLGSSPLTRGKLFPAIASSAADGLIPAHAGKTRLLACIRSGTTAHPRSRGENGSTWDVDLSSPGSSPLTRGKLFPRVDLVDTDRLIPAHAGKTRRPVSAGRRVWAHPRSRGENTVGPCARGCGLGSSPLTRGKPCRSPTRPPSRGLIPAHAGKTDSGNRSWIISRAHPRSRGENVCSVSHHVGCGGSSPLTRGKPTAIMSGSS